jgi:hypothetical protein
MRIFLIFAAVALLGGCASRDKIAKADSSDCASYGAQPGTQAYFQCRMIKDQQHNADAARRSAAMQDALSDMSTNIRAPQVGAASTRCVSRQVGTQVVTDCQ